MFIFWGHRVRSEPRGTVAAYCPVCRDVQAIQVDSLNRVFHIYFIPMGGGESVGHRGGCPVCRGVFPVEPKVARKASFSPPADLRKLVQHTNPQLPQTMHDRFLSLRKLRTDPGAMSPQERVTLMVEPFQAAEAIGGSADISDFLRTVGILLFAGLSLILPVWLWSDANQIPILKFCWPCVPKKRPRQHRRPLIHNRTGAA